LINIFLSVVIIDSLSAQLPITFCKQAPAAFQLPPEF
jgi:hypothetical protein